MITRRFIYMKIEVTHDQKPTRGNWEMFKQVIEIIIATLKIGRGGLVINKKMSFEELLLLQKDADRKRLFCSNVSTLCPWLSEIAFQRK